MPPVDPQMLANPQLMEALAGLGGGGGGMGAPPMGAPPMGAPPMGGAPMGGPPAPPAAGMGMMGDPGMAPMPGPSGQGQQQPPADPTDQVIWAAFPSTDPNTLQQMFGQASGVQGLLQALPALEQMQAQDRAALEQKQQASLHALFDALIGPSPGMAQQAPGPGVGNGPGY